jgi:hypothetical protein
VTENLAKLRRPEEGSPEAAKAKERFYELVGERRRLEERAEEEIAALVGTLDELRDLDAEQRRAEVEGWISDPKGYDQRPRLLVVLHDWLGDRIGDHVYAGRTLGRAAVGHEEPLAERDPLTSEDQA